MNSHHDDRVLIVDALRHDLPLIVGACGRLPCGGLPQAGLLANHCWVVADAIDCLLVSDGRRYGNDALAAERAALTSHLTQVTERVDRLYSAERPGGLDRLDWHLACLRLAADQYLDAADRISVALGSATRADEGSCNGLSGVEHVPTISWPAGWGHRQRARMLAWAAAATGAGVADISRREPLATRAWLRLGVARRARRRVSILWRQDREQGHFPDVLAHRRPQGCPERAFSAPVRRQVRSRRF